MSKTKYASDIELGERYRDEQTGHEGVATAIYFYQHACERVAVETYDSQRREVKSETFDAPRLTHVKTGVLAGASRPGGPARDANVRPSDGVR
jgi:hypothetical protein